MTATHPRPEADSQFDSEYATSLAAYIARPNEESLSEAYELGRRALVEGRNIPELVATHAKALRAILEGNGPLADALGPATAFLADSLSPFEMTHRGYRDAILALRHVNEALEQEVKRIAHALHDEAGSLFVSVHLALAELELAAPAVALQPLRRVYEILDRTEAEFRQLSHELRPTVLDDLGWLPALEFLADGFSRRASLPIRIRSTVSARLPPRLETVLYRVVQETLANATRHAQASIIRIDVSQKGGQLCCLVSDDGRGFDAANATAHGGLGLMGMQERLRAVNGHLQIESRPGHGTQVRVYLPLEV